MIHYIHNEKSGKALLHYLEITGLACARVLLLKVRIDKLVMELVETHSFDIYRNLSKERTMLLPHHSL